MLPGLWTTCGPPVMWIPIGAWIAAVVIAIVLLGFCAYEINWKARRLRSDITDLLTLSGQLEHLRAGITAAQQRIAESSTR